MKSEEKERVMKIEVKDVLHLYLGCEAMYGDLKIVVCGLNINSYSIQNIINEETFKISDIKPILRQLSSMTEEELNEMKFNMPGGVDIPNERAAFYITPHQVAYLLSKSFDLFGLIDAGLAIEKK